MSFGIYIVGFLILIGGLIYGAVILHIAAHWIAVGAIVLLGLAIPRASKPRGTKIRRNKTRVAARPLLEQPWVWGGAVCSRKPVMPWIQQLPIPGQPISVGGVRRVRT